ncbi:hypothetical protein VR010_15140 [Actinomycetaceae bacterium L2_0104]
MESLSIDALLQWFEEQGITVIVSDCGEDWGRYYLRYGLVIIAPRLRDAQKLAVLLHEAHHVQRGDDGHQPLKVEQGINEKVAAALIDPSKYMEAEERFGWHSGAIASELDVPKWVVKAYRRSLERIAA